MITIVSLSILLILIISLMMAIMMMTSHMRERRVSLLDVEGGVT